MKVYNQDKTQILEEYNLQTGRLVEDILTVTFDEVKGVEEQGHYETIKEYENGGKDVKWIVDVEKVEYKPKRTEQEKIFVYVPYTEQELKEIKINELKDKREIECFSVINRGILWYNKLDSEKIEQLEKWYNDWLNITETLIVPTKPDWLK
jgi:hypothetical protein